MGRALTVDEAPEVDLDLLLKMNPERSSQRLNLKLWNIRLDWRARRELGQLSLRVVAPPEVLKAGGILPWWSYRIREYGGQWQVQCAECLSWVIALYLSPQRVWEGQPTCRHCLQLRYRASQVHGHGHGLDVKADLRAGNLEPVLERLQGGGLKAVRAMQAMELEGITPRRLTLEDGTQRRRRNRTIRKRKRKVNKGVDGHHGGD
jgi:hypothetical protein